MFGDVAFAAAPFSALGGNSFAATVIESANAISNLSTIGTNFVAQTVNTISVNNAQTLSYVASAQQSETTAFFEEYSTFGVVFAVTNTQVSFIDAAAEVSSTGVAILERLRASEAFGTFGVTSGAVIEDMALSSVTNGSKRAVATQTEQANIYVDSVAQYAATAALQAYAAVAGAPQATTSTTAAVVTQLAVSDTRSPVKILSSAVADALRVYTTFISGQVQPVDATASFAGSSVVAAPTIRTDRTVSESVAVSDSTVCRFIAQAVVSNTVAGSQQVSPVMVALVRLEASVSVSATHNGNGNFAANLADTVRASTTVNGARITARSIDEQVSGSSTAVLVVLNPAFIDTTLTVTSLQSAKAAFVTTAQEGLRVIDGFIGGQFTQSSVAEVVQVIAEATRKSAWEPDNTDVSANWASSIDSGGNANWGSSIDSGASANWGPINTLD